MSGGIKNYVKSLYTHITTVVDLPYVSLQVNGGIYYARKSINVCINFICIKLTIRDFVGSWVKMMDT